MDVTTFQCPHCQALLRMRSRQLGDSAFACPDCEQPLQLKQTPDGQWTIHQVSTSPDRPSSPPFSHKVRSGLKTLQRGGAFLIASPVLMSWIVAGTGAFLILLMMLLDRFPSETTQTEEQVASVSETHSDDSIESGGSTATKVAAPLQPVVEKQLSDPQPELELQQPLAEDHSVKAVPVDNERKLIAAIPEDIPPLIAQKPLPPAPLPAPATDVILALQIPIVEFRQPDEIPLKILIAQIEEMLDTEFQFAENIKDDPQLMETAVSVSRKNTTLEKLLTLILSKGALTYSVKSNKIHIQRMTSP
ncbi:hypothetical protein [Gimesia fumaroli]|uniref:Uncharacterized protein n=1 Tax=Gimesia fumaroli TaxID=2527976 RepID=A0A518IKE2_9PLAN|nr:hypothetical protein [Gimesia fumaroli]QDV53562.1 hypothetical protein Enr17x_56420 [Gimesia fumaroli]